MTCRSFRRFASIYGSYQIVPFWSRALSRALAWFFYGLNLTRLSLRISFKMSGPYKCLAPFSFIYRPIFIALVRLIIVTLCLVHQLDFSWLESRPCLAQNFCTGVYIVIILRFLVHMDCWLAHFYKLMTPIVITVLERFPYNPIHWLCMQNH